MIGQLMGAALATVTVPHLWYYRRYLRAAARRL